MLAIFAGYLDRKRISPFGEKVERAIQISPTVFPVVFAALIGRFFRAAGLYKAERGSTLSVRPGPLLTDLRLWHMTDFGTTRRLLVFLCERRKTV